MANVITSVTATAPAPPLTTSPPAVDTASLPTSQTALQTEPAVAKYDAIVVGGGPAGMSACIYLARKSLKVLLIAKDLGGQAAGSSDVENYLGYSMITGADLTRHFQDHLEHFKDQITLKLVNDGVKSVAPAGKSFVVTLGNGATETARAVVLASGKVPRHLGIPGEDQYINRGVTYCAWCDGPLFKGKDVAIIGGGNSALDAALSIQKLVRNITIVNATAALTADEVMIDRATAATNIRIINNTQAVGLEGEKFLSAVVIEDQESRKQSKLAVEGVFVEIGSLPATDWLAGFIKLNEDKEIIIDAHNMTSVPGVFAAGDATDVVEKQIIVAAGEGSKAGIQCAKWLAVN